jgi:hypothetical protein
MPTIRPRHSARRCPKHTTRAETATSRPRSCQRWPGVHRAVLRCPQVRSGLFRYQVQVPTALLEVCRRGGPVCRQAPTFRCDRNQGRRERCVQRRPRLNRLLFRAIIEHSKSHVSRTLTARNAAMMGCIDAVRYYARSQLRETPAEANITRASPGQSWSLPRAAPDCRRAAPIGVSSFSSQLSARRGRPSWNPILSDRPTARASGPVLGSSRRSGQCQPSALDRQGMTGDRAGFRA